MVRCYYLFRYVSILGCGYFIMSLDLTYTTDICPHCNRGEDSFYFNYTYNAAPVWYKVFPDDDGMVMIEGMTGKESLPKINKVITTICDNRQEYEGLVRGGGSWGTLEGFRSFLAQLREVAEQYPTGKWSAYR